MASSCLFSLRHCRERISAPVGGAKGKEEGVEEGAGEVLMVPMNDRTDRQMHGSCFEESDTIDFLLQ